MTDYEEVVRLRGRLAELMAERDHLLGSGRIAIDAGEKIIATLRTEKATLTAQCEALEKERQGTLELLDERTQMAESRRLGIIERNERCEALTAERDKWRDQMMNATVALGREGGAHYDDVPRHIRDIRSRCQHLEQAVKDLSAALEPFAQWWLVVREGKPLTLDVRYLEAAKNVLASLLPAQEETPGTDENRVSFAAGYSEALDDALKGKR